MLKGKHIVLGISGGIAAYKSASLLRLLVKAGAEVQVVMTPNAKEFITPATMAALSGKPVVSEFFAANTGEWHSHVDLGLWADLMIVAPATASTIAKMATGVADNMLITTYLSAKEPVMVAPAMDLDMFAHPTTRRNLETLRGDGVMVLESPDGQLASGLSGKGRMLEPEMIFQAVERFFTRGEGQGAYKGKRVLITAGPTFEAIDPVRFIGNHSSGRMGFDLARCFYESGAVVTVVAGPVGANLTLPAGVERVDVVSADEMLEAVVSRYDDADVAVFAAAVADYRPVAAAEKKIKREHREAVSIQLVANPDIAAEMGRKKKSGQINVGFALETDNGTENALRKMKDKNLDMIVLNPAGRADAGFNSDTNVITILDADGNSENFPLMNKMECARVIADRILPLFNK